MKIQTRNQNAVAENHSAQTAVHAAAEDVACKMQNYFELFNLPVSFDIDVANLTSVYLKKQREFAASESNVEILNSAYFILKNPITRAEYFLSMSGKNIEGMTSNQAEQMFKLREEYENLQEQDLKNKFSEDIKKDVDEKILQLANYENDIDIFCEKFAEIKFLNSFLEKVKFDVYSRN